MFYESKGHELSYESVSGFSPKVKNRVRVGFALRLRLAFFSA